MVFDEVYQERVDESKILSNEQEEVVEESSSRPRIGHWEREIVAKEEAESCCSRASYVSRACLYPNEQEKESRLLLDEVAGVPREKRQNVRREHRGRIVKEERNKEKKKIKVSGKS